MIVSYFIIYNYFRLIPPILTGIQARVQIEIQTKISYRKRSCLGFRFRYKILQSSCCDKDKNRLRKRGWAIRDRLVVPFGEEGRDKEINIQRETRCPGR